MSTPGWPPSDDDRGAGIELPALRPWTARPAAEPEPRRPWRHILLFLATLATTTMAGALHAGIDPFEDPLQAWRGLSFSLPLLAILLCHEFGHYAAALRHGVPATLPYFLPGPPFLIGTFGAFIRMRGMPRSRSALFDIGAAGPWAGLVASVPVVAFGLWLSEVRPLAPASGGGLSLGSSLLFDGLSRGILGVNPADATIVLHPVALAGWFGLFVTFLNLLPVGQLDGGHVVYALFGRRHRSIARLFFAIVFAMGFLGWSGWFVWAFLLAFVVRVDHPDTADPVTPLDARRTVAAWLTLAAFAATFMPVPLSVLPDRRPVETRSEGVAPRRRRPPAPAPRQPDAERPFTDGETAPLPIRRPGPPARAFGTARTA